MDIVIITIAITIIIIIIIAIRNIIVIIIVIMITSMIVAIIRIVIFIIMNITIIIYMMLSCFSHQSPNLHNILHYTYWYLSLSFKGVHFFDCFCKSCNARGCL